MKMPAPCAAIRHRIKIEESMNHKALIAVFALALPAIRAQDSSAQMASLLAESKSQASMLGSDLATLDFFAQPNGAQTQAALFSLYQEHIDTLRSDAAKLQAARDRASAPQKTAIDRMVPVMRDFASIAEAALARARAPQAASAAGGNREYFRLSSGLAAEFSAIVSAWADYANTKNALDRLDANRSQ